MATSWVIGVDSEADNSQKRRPKRPKRVSFVDALKKKYCNMDHEIQTKGVVIVFHGKPKSDGYSELGYLHNVVLSNCNIATAGLDGQDLKSLCPNVVDLDLSGNRLVSWNELLPVITQLANLKFLNIANNRLENTQTSLDEWRGELPGIENLVLNKTLLSWQDVLALASKLSSLKELHLCGNDYATLPETRITGLENVECLRMNNNKIQCWEEVWKLRHLPKLKSLVLSGNPLVDVFFKSNELSTPCNKGNSTDLDPSKHVNSGIDNAECSNLTTSDNSMTDNEKVGDDTKGNEQITDSNLQTFVEETITDNQNGQKDVAPDVIGNEDENEATIEALCRQIIQEVIAEFVQEIKNDTSNTNPNCEDIFVSLDEVNQTISSEKSVQEDFSKGDKSDNIYTDSGLNSSKGGNSTSTQCSCDNRPDSFASLQTLCLSDTGISKWKHLSAIRQFPALKSLRIQDVKLGSKLSREDRRKLFVASLPNIHHLNGSEITSGERDKSERHLLRHFSDKKNKPEIYTELEKKHGQLAPLVDIDISRGYQERATLTFLHQSKTICTETFNVRQPVGRLRQLIARKLCLYGSIKHIKMYHRLCNPQHFNEDNPEPLQEFEELVLDTIPMSRFDIMDGDEIHFEMEDNFSVGALEFLHLRMFMPDRQISGIVG